VVLIDAIKEKFSKIFLLTLTKRILIILAEICFSQH